MNTELARFNMIEQQIRPWEVLDQAVLSLLATVRREDFVPPALKALAFVDTQVPLGDGQSMLEPKVEARLLQELQVQRHERVLEVGTGSGFMAALLAHRAMHVVSLECRPVLAAAARESLARNGIANVKVVDVLAAAGAHGLPAEAPFDVIVLSGSVAEVPLQLLQQLKPGGRLVAVVGEEPIMRARLFTAAGDSAGDSAGGAAGRAAGGAAGNPPGSAGYTETDLFDTVAPRLEGFVEPSRFFF